MALDVSQPLQAIATLRRAAGDQATGLEREGAPVMAPGPSLSRGCRQDLPD